MKRKIIFRGKNTSLYLLFLSIFLCIFSGAKAHQGSKTLLWKISGNGLASCSYLFGTMHIGDKKILNFKKSVLSAFKSCQVYAMELNPDEVNPMALLEEMKLKKGKLEDLFTAEEWKKLDDYFHEKFKTPLSTFNEFSPFYVHSLIVQARIGSKANQAVDMYLYDQARQCGMGVVGIETLDEQLAAVNNLPVDDQKQLLLDAIDQDFEAVINEMIKLYKKSDLDGLQKMSFEEDYGVEFETNIITDRNRVMAERIISMIRKQSTFVGVGALHLPGGEGLIQLLQNAGFTVEPVK